MIEFFKAVKDFFTGKKDYGTGSAGVKKAEEEKKKTLKFTGDVLKDSEKTVLKQIEKVGVNIKSKLRETFGLSGSNDVLREEVNSLIPEGYAGGILKLGQKPIKAFKDALKTVQYQRDMDIISEEEYYAALESLRDKYFMKNSDMWIEYTAEIYTYQKKLLEEEKKRYEETYDEIFEYASDKIDAVIKKQEAYEKKLQSYGRVFQKNTIRLDEGDIEFYSLADLKKDNDQLERYTSLMLEAKKFVKESGLSDDAVSSLLEDISELPVASASTALEALMKNPQSKSWLEEYERRVQLSKTESALYYEEDMTEALDDTARYMEEKLTQAGFSIPATFFDAGKESAERFGEGFSEELSAELERIKAQIAEFTSLIEVSVTQESTDDKTKSGDEINTTNYYITADTLKEDIASTIRRYETIKRLGGY